MTYDPEIEKLLPWYAKDLLEPEEAAKVERYLSDHPDMRTQLDLIAEEVVAIDQQYAALGAPSGDGLQKLLADIDRLEAEKTPVANAATGLWSKMLGWFAGFSSPGMQFAGMAAAFVIIAQGVIIGGLINGASERSAGPTGFTTASGPEQAVAISQGAVFLVAFNKEARMNAVAELLKAQSARIVSGPKGGGFFEISIARDALPKGGTKAVLEALKARPDLIQFVSAVK